MGCIAQLVEQLTLNQRAAGSSPAAPTKKSKTCGTVGNSGRVGVRQVSEGRSNRLTEELELHEPTSRPMLMGQDLISQAAIAVASVILAALAAPLLRRLGRHIQGPMILELTVSHPGQRGMIDLIYSATNKTERIGWIDSLTIRRPFGFVVVDGDRLVNDSSHPTIADPPRTIRSVRRDSEVQPGVRMRWRLVVWCAPDVPRGRVISIRVRVRGDKWAPWGRRLKVAA
jgi:hypothetical protein